MKTLNDFISGTLADHAKLVASGIPSLQALNIASFPSQIEALQDTLMPMPTYTLEKIIEVSKEMYVSVQGRKSIYFLSGIQKKDFTVVFEYTEYHLGSDFAHIPLYELEPNQFDNIMKAVNTVL